MLMHLFRQNIKHTLLRIELFLHFLTRKIPSRNSLKNTQLT